MTRGSQRGTLKSMGSRAWGLLAAVLMSPALASGDLVHDLASRDVVQRRRAVRTLEEVPTLPPETIAPLVDCLHDSDFILAESAMRALGHGGPAARAALEPLLTASDLEVRARAGQALGRLVASDPDAWLLVLRAFRDDAIREHVAGAVSKVGVQAVPGLVAALDDADARVRRGAVRALEWIGPPARSTAPRLARVLQDPDPAVRRAAAFALAKVDPASRDAVPELSAALPDSLAACALGALEPPPAEAATALADTMLHGSDELAQRCAASALGRAGVGDSAVKAALVAALEHEKPQVRQAAAVALGGWGAMATDAVPALASKLADDWAGSSAAAALAKIGASGVAALATSLTSDDLDVRKNAVAALEGMDHYPDAATDALVHALDDPSSDVRARASRALSRAHGRRVKTALARYAEAEEHRYTPAPVDPERVFTKAEIVAARPPDGDHKYPLELESLVPIERTDLVVSLHRGRGWGDELVIWAKVDGGYRRLRSFVDESQMGSSYDPVRSFRYGGTVFLVVSYFGGSAVSHDTSDTILAVEQYVGVPPTLTEVEVESPRDWYRARLRPDESVWNSPALMLADDRLEWSFGIWNAGDPHCCPSGGEVRGTFAICMDRQHDAAAGRWTSTWHMFVADGTRERPRAQASPDGTSLGRIRDGCAAIRPTVVPAGALPDAAGRLPGDP